MSQGEFLRKFKAAQRGQMQARKMDEYLPLSDATIARSDELFVSDHRSVGFQMLSTYCNRSAPIIYLYGSARVMFLLDCENGAAPVAASETFNSASEFLLDVLDAAIADVPTDLLILLNPNLGGTFISDLVAGHTIEQILKVAEEYEGDVQYHSLVRLEAHLLCLHCKWLGRAGFVAFRRAMVSICSIGLFEDDGVSPLALDFFPSLADREKELVLRRAELKWRPETSDDPVVRVGVTST